MKQLYFTILILLSSSAILLYSQSIAPKLTYAEAIKLAFNRSPDIRVASLELEKARGQKLTASRLLTANPEVEATLAYGIRKILPAPSFSPSAFLQGANPFDLSPNSIFHNLNQSIKGYELVVTQQLEVAGKNLLERKIADCSVDHAIIALERVKLNLRSSIRLHMITLAAMEKLNAEMSSRLNHLRAFWKQKGSTFIDTNLGPYAGRVFLNDMLEMESDRQQVEQAGEISRIALRSLLMIPEDNDFRVGTPESIPLPTIPDDQLLVQLALKSNIDLRDAETSLKMSREEEKLSRLLIVPNPSLFVGFGRQIVESAGRYGPEHEDEQIGKFGIRIELPFNSTRGERISAKAEYEKAESNVDRIRNTIRKSVLNATLIYRQQIASLEQLQYGVKRSSEALNQIDQAFMNGRISYFDFWNEYDRSNRFIKHYNETLISAATACGQLEMLIGHSLDKD
jgi:outer membrane protein TolC